MACTGHYRLAQPAVELRVPLRVSAKTERHALDADFDHSAQRVACLPHLVDQCLDLGVLIGIERVQFALVAQRMLFFQRARLGVNCNRSNFDDITEDGNAERDSTIAWPMRRRQL